jgi:DNA helicase HerA-like ATPase
MVAVSRFVLQKIYSDMLAKGPINVIRVFAVIDEAHKLSYDETLTELVREARKYGIGLLLASQSPKDFDRVAFDLMGTKIALHLEGEDAKIMADNLGVINKDDRNIARELTLTQPNLRALMRNNHYEPYVQVDIIPFFKKP